MTIQGLGLQQVYRSPADESGVSESGAGSVGPGKVSEAAKIEVHKAPYSASQNVKEFLTALIAIRQLDPDYADGRTPENTRVDLLGVLGLDPDDGVGTIVEKLTEGANPEFVEQVNSLCRENGLSLNGLAKPLKAYKKQHAKEARLEAKEKEPKIKAWTKFEEHLAALDSVIDKTLENNNVNKVARQYFTKVVFSQLAQNLIDLDPKTSLATKKKQVSRGPEIKPLQLNGRPLAHLLLCIYNLDEIAAGLEEDGGDAINLKAFTTELKRVLKTNKPLSKAVELDDGTNLKDMLHYEVILALNEEETAHFAKKH